MKSTKSRFVIIAIAALLVAGAAACARGPRLPGVITDHGVASPVGTSAWGGTAATADADGRRLVFIKLWGGGDTASYLFIDAETGRTEQIDPGIGGIGAYLVFLSPENKVYDTMGEWFLEIDVPTRQIHRIGKIPSGMALSFTMDDDGVIYAGIYPSATLVSYNPRTQKYTDHGQLNKQDWPQYLRPLVIGDQGWIYGGIAIKAGQVVGYNLATGETKAYVPEADRGNGAGEVFRGQDGKVYAKAPGWGWHALSGGEAVPVETAAEPTQARAVDIFPDGSRCVDFDVHNRTLRILDKGAADPREVKFDYECVGPSIFSMVAGPDGRIYGATGVPLRIWRFDPASGEMKDWGLGRHGGHANQFVRQGERLYAAVYSSGSLIELDPSRPVHDAPIKESTNPRQLHGYKYGYGGDPDMFGRPHAMLAHPDGVHVVLGGNPARARVGGGLLIYNVKTGEEVVLKPEQLVPDQGVHAMAALADGGLIIGSTTEAATGGSSTATAAMLYRLDWESKQVTARWTLEPQTSSVHDLVVAGDGLVYGLAAGERLFVFDPKNGAFVHDEVLSSYGRLTGSQAPRTMAIGPDGGIYALFDKAIVRIEPGSFTHREIARSNLEITAGIVIHRNRLYFACGSHLYSCDLSLR
jgi:hypothetical protein